METKRIIMYNSSIILICFVLTSSSIYAQNNDKISIEADVNYFYHFIPNGKNNFNYGLSFLASNRKEKVKISTGIIYSTKYYYFDNYHQDPYSSSNIIKRKHRSQYLNIPLFLSIGKMDKEKISANLLVGVMLNLLQKYEQRTYYSDNPNAAVSKTAKSDKTGITIRLGGNFSKNISNRFLFNASPFCDLKIISNQGEVTPSHFPVDYAIVNDNIMSFGLKLGIEYLFN